MASNGAVRYSEFTPTNEYLTSSDLVNEYTQWYLNESALTNALKYRVFTYQHLEFADIDAVDTPITSYNSSCLDNMKTLLSSGLILTIDTDFGDNNSDWIYDTLSNQNNTTLNGQYVCIGSDNVTAGRQGHAMAIVGYNDNITYDLNGNGSIQNFERGAFKVVNSHGNNWKNNGFIWVMYDALNNISNAEAQNYENRKAIFSDYGYYAISVKEYPRDVLVKVKLNHNDRTQIKLMLGVSEPNSTTPSTTMSTMLLQNTSSTKINFSGTGASSEDATFIFDLGDLYALDTERSNCYISISDHSNTGSTILKELELIDGTGKTIVLNTNDVTISSKTMTYSFKLGIVGDINNDTNIDNSDAKEIQKHIAGLITLSYEELIVADVNGDGNVNTLDVTDIQNYANNTLTEFDNGSVVLLD